MNAKIFPSTPDGFFQHPSVKRWRPFLIKAIVVLGLLLILSKASPILPVWGIALLWATLGAASAIGIAYPWVISKTHKQAKYEKGGLLARLNGGRVISILVSFVLGSIFASSLIAESPKWEPLEWCVVALSIPLYLLVGTLVRKCLTKQFTPTFREAGIVTWTGGITAVLLCILYLILLFVVQPDYGASNATEVYLSAKQPFENSASALMVETGKLTALIDGLSMFGIAKVAEISLEWAMLWRLILCVSSFCGITSLLGLCSLGREEYKRVYQTLDDIGSPNKTRVLVKRYACFAIALPLCLVAVFLVSDSKVSQVAQTAEYTYAEQVIRSQVSMVVYVLDGKYYDKQEVELLIADVKSKSESLSAEARETIVPLINASYDKRLANVEGYLDWYYSLFADYERLANLVAGSEESYAAEQFTSIIEDGIDDTELVAQMDNYAQQAESLRDDLMSELANCEIKNVPEWLFAEKDLFDMNFLEASLEPTNQMLTASERFGFSAAGGFVTGLIAKKVVTNVLAKPFFEKIVSKIASAVGLRVVSAAAGATAGSVVPGVGTAVGAVVGTAASVGVDYALLELDEMQNRDSYRQEIVDAIEESRSEALAMFQ